MEIRSYEVMALKIWYPSQLLRWIWKSSSFGGILFFFLFISSTDIKKALKER